MSRKIKIDMTGVESYTRCPEGEWYAKLKKIEMGEVQGSGDDALKAVFEVIKGDAKGNQVFETFSLTEKALWKLKSFLDAIGIKSDGRLSLDLDKLEGKVCIIDVIHDEYNGTKRAKISSYIKPGSQDDEDEEEDLEEEDEEEETPPKKSAKKPASKKPAKKRPDPDDDEDEEDDEDDDEDEESVKPAKKSSKKDAKKPAKKASKKPVDDEDDDDDWEEDDD